MTPTVPTEDKGPGSSPVPLHQHGKGRGAKGKNKVPSTTVCQASRDIDREQSEGEDKVGPDTQRRHEDEGSTRAPGKSLCPFRKQRPDLWGESKKKKKARREPIMGSKASESTTSTEVYARPVML